MKHSTESWIVGNNGLDVHSSSADFTEICTAFSNKHARLIAAAPEMLTTLEISEIAVNNVIKIAELNEDHTVINAFKPVLAQIQKTLKKARGEL